VLNIHNNSVALACLNPSLIWIGFMQDFHDFISMYYRAQTSEPIRGYEYVERHDYFVSFENMELSPKRGIRGTLWEDIMNKRGPLEMGVVMSRSIEGSSADKHQSSRCIRCNTLLLPGAGWPFDPQTSCLHCDLKMHPPEQSYYLLVHICLRTTFDVFSTRFR